MQEHQARKASGYYERYRPRLHHEHTVEKDAVAARHQRKMEGHRRSADHQRNTLQSIEQHSSRLQEQLEQGRDTYAQQAALNSVLGEALRELKRLQAARGELTGLLHPPCVAPASAALMAVLCSCGVLLCIAVRHMAGRVLC